MTDDMIALRELLEKGSDAGFLHEMIGFSAERLMSLETEALRGADTAARQRSCDEPSPRRDQHTGHTWRPRHRHA